MNSWSNNYDGQQKTDNSTNFLKQTQTLPFASLSFFYYENEKEYFVEQWEFPEISWM